MLINTVLLHGFPIAVGVVVAIIIASILRYHHAKKKNKKEAKKRLNKRIGWYIATLLAIGILWMLMIIGTR
ncbi:MAG TPA: hypothetical protein VGE63_01465 [Candidatus Paceibacterota bacterium]